MYEEQILNTKAHYPFKRWRSAYDDGLEQYTAENCTKAQEIYDKLIQNLVLFGEEAIEEEKVSFFKKAITALNHLNRECDDCLIETGEREELCELTNQISIAAGLDPEKYGEGEGLASEWRDW